MQQLFGTVAVVAVVVSFMGCGWFSTGGPIEITEAQSLPAEERIPPQVVDTATRMGIAPDEPPGHPSASALPTGSNALFDIDRLHWQTPEGWRRAEDRPMRLATYVPDKATTAACVISVLAGEAGGIAANLNRWRAQLGLAPLEHEEVDALPRWNMLGTEAVFLQCAAQGDDDTEAVLLYGVICPMPEHTLFVKMVGPDEEVASEQERFKALCLSFHMGEEASQ